MTLVIAMRKKNHVEFTSDSRISFGNDGYIDIGIKIFSNPTAVYSYTDSQTNTSTLDYENKIGLAVIGSSINSYLIKDAIYEILQNVQQPEIRGKFSFEEIAKLVFKIYKRTSEDLGFLRNVGQCSLILGGYCLIQEKIRLFKFEPLKIDGIWSQQYSEFLTEDGFYCFGSGKEQAQMIHQNEPDLSPLKVIRRVINEGRIPSVGGGMQYGEFFENNFRILGVEDYTLDENGNFKDYLYTLRGISLYKDEFDYEDCDLHINYKIIRAFHSEIEELKKRQLDNLIS